MSLLSSRFKRSKSKQQQQNSQNDSSSSSSTRASTTGTSMTISSSGRIAYSGEGSRVFLWCWGNLSQRIPCKNPQRTPKLVESLDTERISSVSCNGRYVTVVLRSGIIYIWQLGRSLKKYNKKWKLNNNSNIKNNNKSNSKKSNIIVKRPSSLKELVKIMKNQLPIITNYNNDTKLYQNHSINIQSKRLFYGNDAVKWLVSHAAVEDENEAIRFCQALVTKGFMERGDIVSGSGNDVFENNRESIYYFSDSRKKITSQYMQNFASVGADPTLRFIYISTTQTHMFGITDDYKLFEWDLNKKYKEFVNKNNNSNQNNNKPMVPQKPNITLNTHSNTLSSEINVEEEYSSSDSDLSESDPLDDDSLSNTTKSDTTPKYIKNNLANTASNENISINGNNINNVNVQMNIGDKKRNSKSKSKSDRIEKRQEAVKSITQDWMEHDTIHKNKKVKDLDKLLLVEKVSYSPKLIDYFVNNKINIRNISCGNNFILTLTNEGHLYSWGNGNKGKLGHGNEDSLTEPKKIDIFIKNDIKYKIKNFKNNKLDSKLDYDENDINKNVVISRIGCGFDHCVAISSTGELYSWGNNDCGKLGLGDLAIRSRPHKVNVFTQDFVDKYHTTLFHKATQINDNKNNKNNKKMNLQNNLKNNNNEEKEEKKDEKFNLKDPNLLYKMLSCIIDIDLELILDNLNNNNNLYFIEISCGYSHNLAVVAGNGYVYSWGGNRCGQLGINDRTNRYLPYLIKALINKTSNELNIMTKFNKNKSKTNNINSGVRVVTSDTEDEESESPDINKIKNNNINLDSLNIIAKNSISHVSCGSFHSCALSTTGDVFTWGDNNEGQLGTGINIADSITPLLVDYLSGMDTSTVVCGSDFTFAVSDNFLVLQPNYFPRNKTLSKISENNIKTTNSTKTHKLFNKLKDRTQLLKNNSKNTKVFQNSQKFFRNLGNKIRKYQDDSENSLSYNNNDVILDSLDDNSTRNYRPNNLPKKSVKEIKKHKKEVERVTKLFQIKETEKANNRNNEAIVKTLNDNNLTIQGNDNNNTTRKNSTSEPSVSKSKSKSKSKSSKFGFSRLKRNRSKNNESMDGYDDGGTMVMDYWLKVVLPNWEKEKNSTKLREYIWKYGIPPRLRGKAWPKAIGNKAMITQNLFNHFHMKAKQAYQLAKKHKQNKLEKEYQNIKKNNEKIEEEKKESKKDSLNKDDISDIESVIKMDVDNVLLMNKEKTIHYIETDLARTFPTLSYFQEDGPLQETLGELLQTYCFYRPDIGYVQGMSFLAANLLLYMDNYLAFVSFANLLNWPFFHAFLSMNPERINNRYLIFELLFESNLPQLYLFFKSNDILPSMYFMDWSITLFSKKLNEKVTPRIWDILLMFGEIEVYRCSVAILKILKNKLLNLDIDLMRSKLKLLPKEISQNNLINTMKTIKVNKKIKQKLYKLNQKTNL